MFVYQVKDCLLTILGYVLHFYDAISRISYEKCVFQWSK